MKGQDVFKFAIKAIPLSIDYVLNQAKMTLNDIDYVICHQANERIIKHVYKKYQCSSEKFYMNLQEYGNTSAASIPLALAKMNEQGLLQKGMKNHSRWLWWRTYLGCNFNGMVRRTK